MESSPVSVVRSAMGRLGWGTRELYVATFAYGTVGREHDVDLHLSSGDHLGRFERAVIAAALNDALMDQGEQFPVL